MNWNEAKSKLDKMEFPSDTEGWNEIIGEESHSKKRFKHQLLTYVKWFEIDGYELEAKYNYCKDCGEIRNKKLILWNNEDGVYSEKTFVWHGENVEDKNLLDTAKNIFMSFVPLLVI